MAEKPYYIGSGAKPQSLDQTLDDLKRIGSGLLVGETADILGLPADLIGLYQDLRYGKTSEGVQSFIDQYGSEALAKRFMGKEFPEFGMNLESFGRAVAPGALLSKGIMTARLAARGGRPPSDSLAMATAGQGRLEDDVPRTTSEQLMMTRIDDGGEPRKIDTGEDDFFKSDVGPESRLNTDGIVFSNLIDFIEKNGLGIDFNKKPTSTEIRRAFDSLKRGPMKQRLEREATESGLYRYLENNPNEKFSSLDQLVGKATLFKPTIKISTYSLKQQEALTNKQAELLIQQSNDPDNLQIKQELDIVNAQILEYEPEGKNALINMDSQLIPVDGRGSNQALHRNDVVHIIFHGDESDDLLLGKKIDTKKTSEQDQLIGEVEKYFKTMGQTSELKKLEKFKQHGFGKFPGYFGHIRAVGVIIPDPTDPTKSYKTLYVNEIQTNQAGEKARSVRRDQPPSKSIKKLEEKMRAGTITQDEQVRLDNLKRASTESVYGDMMMNQKRMDALQIIKEDEALKTGFVAYADKKKVLQDEVTNTAKNLNEADSELNKLQQNLVPFKNAMFKVDQQVNRDRTALNDFKNAKEQLYQDLVTYRGGDPGLHDAINPDVQMPEFLATMMNQRVETGPKSGNAHFTTSEYYSILDQPTSPDDIVMGGPGRTYDGVDEPMLDENLRNLSKQRYGATGRIDPLVDILGGQQGDLLKNDFKFGGETMSINPDYRILDSNMLKDYYRDLVKAYNDGNLTDEMFGELDTYNVYYDQYVKVKKAANGDDYFLDPANYQKTTRYILDDKEKRLEVSFLKSNILNKLMNDSDFVKTLDEDNINEIKNRLLDLNTRRNNMSQTEFIAERKKIYDDFSEDIGADTRQSILSKSLERISREVYDDWIKQGNKPPRVPGSVFYNKQIRGKDKPFFGFGKGYIFDENAYNKEIQYNINYKDGRSLVNDLIESVRDDHMGRGKSATIINSLVAKKNIQNYQEGINNLKKKKDEAIDKAQEANRLLDEFNDKNDLDEILKSLKEKLPDNLKNNLDVIVDHQLGRKKLTANPPIQNSQQATELMIHGLIKKAKELGYERVIIPNVQTYASASGRRGQLRRKMYGDTTDSMNRPLITDEVPYSANIGKNATDALKKYGDGYSEADKVLIEKKELSPRLNQSIAMPKQYTNFGVQSSQMPNVPSEDKFRIIDLTNEDVIKKTNLKIPRMAKGGIFEKFRKVS